MVDALFDPKDRTATSIKEVYIELTGDKRVTGVMRHCDRTRIAEAIQTGTGAGAGVFADVFGDSIARRMQREYAQTGIYDWWMRVYDTVPVSDFRQQERTRWGGYGNLPDVAQSGSYAALTSPKDVKEIYSVSKRGGLESITLEGIKNDDMSVVQRIPMRLAMAAKRTVSAYCAGLFTANSGAGQTLNADSAHLFALEPQQLRHRGALEDGGGGRPARDVEAGGDGLVEAPRTHAALSARAGGSAGDGREPVRAR